ncbi:MAG: bifunctional glutamate N-acetyltransferase/amino-acid acetyltransferase ArgJ [Pseudomonadota bacterium]
MNFTKSPLAPDKFPDLPEIQGVRAATGSRGFYRAYDPSRDDVFLFAFEPGTNCAGVFTQSTTASADVLHCRNALEDGGGSAGALIANSGNSNAFTGPKGEEKNKATLRAIAAELNVPADQAFIAATGVIGEPLPDPNYIGTAVPDLVRRMDTPDWLACAKAFMTTDTFPKGAGLTVDLNGVEIGFSGIAKGSGMIAPNMATMLAFVFTDAAIAPAVLDQLIRDAADMSFNSVTVDGDTSTSDTFMIFATGASGAPMIETAEGPEYEAVRKAVNTVALDLAQQLVRDGEGASKFVSIIVSGAETPQSAKVVASSIANSPLVKTALAASDANWGRIVMAAGKSGEPFDQSDLDIWFGDYLVAKSGARSVEYDEEKASAIFAEQEITIRVKLGDGPGSATVYTCDLTHAYIDINGAYRT